MSSSKDDQDDQDPDYARPGRSNETHQKFFEETARANVARKITAIVEKEFSQEIEAKEKEILEIDEKLHNALKTLHFLRYVIITDFYNRKQCQAAPSVGECKQTQIHPAIKQMIGKAPKTENFLNQEIALTILPDEGAKNRGDEISNVSEIEKRLTTNSNDSSEDFLRGKKSLGKRSKEDFASENGPPKKVPRYVPPRSSLPEPQVPSRGARHKVRKRMIVGNISKWISPDWREDAASHKWTVYVRGDKENSDISDFVGKIRFFLHPSYRPNDVVEITSPPFHLSRRGWGEFPVRVQLHFKNSVNKPMDIIHYLKLDRTYTGLQTLGSETVVDVWIKTGEEIVESNMEKADGSKNGISGDLTATIKEEPMETSEKSDSNNDSTFEFVVCEQSIKVENEIKEERPSHVYFEHDYVNFPAIDTMRMLENENNVTISHSPPRNKENLGIESRSSATEIPTRALNGNSKLETMDSSSNISISQDVKTMASNLENSSSKLRPLKIAIPEAFEGLRKTTNVPISQKKQILVMRDNKFVPVNSMNVTSNKNSQISTIVSTIVSDGSNLTKNLTARSNVSLLKKPTGGNKTSMLLTLNQTNSLLLDSSNTIPALKIVEPGATNDRTMCPVDHKMSHRPSVQILSKVKNNGEESSQHWLDNLKFTTKPKITLGKDRIGTTSKKEHYNEILRSIDEVEIRDVSALVRFVIRRLPLVTEKATDPEYRNLHPYATPSENEFLESNVGKQRALEWYRAKRVKSFLKKKNIPEELQWSVKEIMMWSRLHGYTPLRSLPKMGIGNSGVKSSEKNLPEDIPETTTCTFTEPTGLLEFLRKTKEIKLELGAKKNEDDHVEIIDVIDITSPERISRAVKAEKSHEKKNIMSLGIPEKIVPLQSYVCDTTRKIGLKLEPEEILPGVLHCAPARMIVKAVQCLLEDLLRSSLAKAWERSVDGGSPDTITVEDVRGAILNREEFDVFTNEGLGSHYCLDD
ncbi:YEATS domain-containing protein 2 [Venturia canescens]|uniref:YEATS domain-containing protein 2 n=1 Tax=Venturia canescens TaxID=32260 RepID=UPI001C9CF491|nr:YEATS domain-containing protein 2 [Venturia canescens]XP_043280546.1 YEATS domain-containing protein 2 [Venturia canescens]